MAVVVVTYQCQLPIFQTQYRYQGCSEEQDQEVQGVVFRQILDCT